MRAQGLILLFFLTSSHSLWASDLTGCLERLNQATERANDQGNIEDLPRTLRDASILCRNLKSQPNINEIGRSGERLAQAFFSSQAVVASVQQNQALWLKSIEAIFSIPRIEGAWFSAIVRGHSLWSGTGVDELALRYAHGKAGRARQIQVLRAYRRKPMQESLRPYFTKIFESALAEADYKGARALLEEMVPYNEVKSAWELRPWLKLAQMENPQIIEPDLSERLTAKAREIKLIELPDHIEVDRTRLAVLLARQDNVKEVWERWGAFSKGLERNPEAGSAVLMATLRHMSELEAMVSEQAGPLPKYIKRVNAWLKKDFSLSDRSVLNAPAGYSKTSLGEQLSLVRELKVFDIQLERLSRASPKLSIVKNKIKAAKILYDRASTQVWGVSQVEEQANTALIMLAKRLSGELERIGPENTDRRAELASLKAAAADLQTWKLK